MTTRKQLREAHVIQAMRDEGLSQRKIAECYGTTTIKGYLEREC